MRCNMQIERQLKITKYIYYFDADFTTFDADSAKLPDLGADLSNTKYSISYLSVVSKQQKKIKQK